MMSPRKGFRVRLGRRRRPVNRLKEATEQARREGRELAKRRRAEARRRGHVAQQDTAEHAQVRLHDAALETQRRLRPAGAVVGGFLGRVAPRISAGLLLAVRVPAALVALVLEVSLSSLRWLRQRLSALASAGGRFLQRTVTPARTAAVVGLAAAAALGLSQFFDYHGVAVGAPDYAGEVGSVAPAPLTDTSTAGSAHLYLLLGVAVAAAVLIVATYRGRSDLARWIAACGAAGILISLAVDLPQGLDAGRAGLSFSGPEARLLEGFWAQLAASAVLVLCGLLLARSPQRATAPERSSGPGWMSRRLRLTRRRRPSAAEVGAFGPRAGTGR